MIRTLVLTLLSPAEQSFTTVSKSYFFSEHVVAFFLSLLCLFCSSVPSTSYIVLYANTVLGYECLASLAVCLQLHWVLASCGVEVSCPTMEGLHVGVNSLLVYKCRDEELGIGTNRAGA